MNDKLKIDYLRAQDSVANLIQNAKDSLLIDKSKKFARYHLLCAMSRVESFMESSPRSGAEVYDGLGAILLNKIIKAEESLLT